MCVWLGRREGGEGRNGMGGEGREKEGGGERKEGRKQVQWENGGREGGGWGVGIKK